MRKTKLELENQLFDFLSRYQTTTMHGMMRHLCCKKENLQGIIKQYEKTDTNPLGLIKINKKNIPYEYSLETTSYDELHNHLEEYIRRINDMINIYIKNLKKMKPIFKNVKGSKIGKEVFASTAHSNQRTKDFLENISSLLDDVHQLSFLITYYKTLNQIPTNKIKQADKDQELCIKTYLDIIKKLRTVVGRRALHQKALEGYLFRHQMILRRLDLLR